VNGEVVRPPGLDRDDRFWYPPRSGCEAFGGDVSHLHPTDPGLNPATTSGLIQRTSADPIHPAFSGVWVQSRVWVGVFETGRPGPWNPYAHETAPMAPKGDR
jgi:hypothetical protein